MVALKPTDWLRLHDFSHSTIAMFFFISLFLCMKLWSNNDLKLGLYKPAVVFFSCLSSLPSFSAFRSPVWAAEAQFVTIFFYTLFLIAHPTCQLMCNLTADYVIIIHLFLFVCCSFCFLYSGCWAVCHHLNIENMFVHNLYFLCKHASIAVRIMTHCEEAVIIPIYL